MTDNIRVVCRFRPVNKREMAEGDGPGSSRIVVDYTGLHSLDLENHQNREAKKHTFNFDHVIPPTWTQEQVYETTAKPLLEDVFKGISVCQLYYGQTGAGKSFSSFGLKTEKDRGVVPRFAEDIFKRINETPDVEFTVKVSYVEIYNEAIRDLLDTSKTNLKVRSSGNAVWVEGAAQEYVKTADDIQEVINRGASGRAVASTLMNAESSRSHSVVLITIGQKSSQGVRGAKLTIVDLAGSERVGKTGATGETLKEAQNINKSLSALGNVINALSTVPKKGEKVFVPYRDSKLTWLLSDSLGGTSKTVMFIAASPCYFNLPETYSTCLFGQRCKTIKNKVVVNQHLSEAEYQRLLQMKDAHIMMLANILGDVYFKLNNMYTNVSQVGLDSNEGVSSELTPYQRGQVAVVPNPSKHATWDQFKHEYQPPTVNVPMILGAVNENQDLSKVFDTIDTTSFDDTSSLLDITMTPPTSDSSPLPPPPNSYLSIDPSIDLPGENNSNKDENDENDENDDNGDQNDPDLLADFNSPLFTDNAAMILSNTDAEYQQQIKVLDSLEDLVKMAEKGENGEKIAPLSPTDELSLSKSLSSSSSATNTGTELITRARTGSVDVGGLKLLTVDGGVALSQNTTASTPTDQVLALLRSHFNKNGDKTQEILDSLLLSPNDDVTGKLLMGLHGVVPAPVKKKVVKKKVVSSTVTDVPTETTSATVTNNATVIAEEEKEAGDEDDGKENNEKEDEKKSEEEKKTSGKKVVKKVVKKVIKKGSSAAETKKDDEEKPIVGETVEKVTDDAKVVEEIKKEEVENVEKVEEIQEKIQVAKIEFDENTQVEKIPENVQKGPEIDATVDIILETQPEKTEESTAADDIFAHTSTANFATYSPHSSDEEQNDDSDRENLENLENKQKVEKDEENQQNQENQENQENDLLTEENDEPQDLEVLTKQVVFDDDDDDVDFKPTLILTDDILKVEGLNDENDQNSDQNGQNVENDTQNDENSNETVLNTSITSQSSQDNETQQQIVDLQTQLDELQKQLEESQLHVKSLKLQNDLLKDQQDDLQAQAATATAALNNSNVVMGNGGAPPGFQPSQTEEQIQQEIKEKQLIVQNEALSIALERKCRDLIKSEVRLSSCVYHIERLEDAYQILGKDKIEVDEKYTKSQQQVNSVHSLSQQLLKTAKYWQQRAERAEELSQQAAVTANTNGGANGANGANNVNNMNNSANNVNNKIPQRVVTSSVLPKASVGATLPPRRSFEPPPTRANMASYTQKSDMKNFF